MTQLVLTFLALSFAVSCSLTPSQLSYKDLRLEMPMQAESFYGKDLGSVYGNEGGAIWDTCEERARASLKAMIEQARQRGANAIGDIVWRSSKNSKPTCKKKWGYAFFFPLLFGPWFMDVHVSGRAYKVLKK